MKIEKIFSKPSPPVLAAGSVLAVVLVVLAILAYNSSGRPVQQDNVLPPLSPVYYSPTPSPTGVPPAISSEVPEFDERVVLSGLSAPWDILFFGDDEFVFTQKRDTFVHYKDGKQIQLTPPADLKSEGEGGLMGLAVDPEFSTNNYIYACYNSVQNDVRVARYVFDPAQSVITHDRFLITGMPAIASGRHSGCQLEFGPDGFLWVGTGDAAQSSNPQDLQNLGGKILRIDRNGNPAYDNLQGGADLRIYSYGHRNVQGLGFFDPRYDFAAPGINIEHGSGVDDEVNPLLPGNFGWDPFPPYIEIGVPMTDLNKFPDAVSAIWSSGSPTIATSGGTVIQGTQWKGWNQAVAVAAQKDQHVMIVKVNKDLSLGGTTRILDQQYGRIRTVQQGLDGNLYVLTDNRENPGTDVVVRLTPKP